MPLICCCCPDGAGNGSTGTSTETVATARSGSVPDSQLGIPPNVIQIVAPEQYAREERYEESLDSGGGGAVGLPEDPNWPSDARSDPLAWTPMYRGLQNSVFDVQFDPYIYHGPGSESLGYAGGDWANIEWDGVTTYPLFCPNTLSQAELEAYRIGWYNFLFPPGQFCIRGLKQLYDMHQPFADPYHPTVHEWELWNDKVLNHFRFLSGLNPATPLQELYIMCAWTHERKTRPTWDEKYPGTQGSAYGPCYDPWSDNIHCGTTFKPSDPEDQYPYWNEVFTKFPKCVMPDPITLNQGSEAVTVWYNGTAMTALSRNIRALISNASVGLQIGGHAGPYCFRQYYGLRIGRSKWAGSLQYPPAGYTY